MDEKFNICLILLGYDNQHHNNGNNGFGIDSTLNNLNGMTNVPVSNNMLLGLPALTQSNTLPTVTSESISAPTDQRGTFIFPSQKTISWEILVEIC